MASAEVDAWMRDGKRRQRRWIIAGTVVTVVVGLVVVIIALAMEWNAIPAGDQRAIRAVEAQGFHHVILGGASVLACAPDESSRHFSATNPAGQRVEGTVCCGLTGVAKGCTLRW